MAGVYRFTAGRATAPWNLSGVCKWKAKILMAFWKRYEAMPGDLIGDDRSDEPRVTVDDVENLYAGSGSDPSLASWDPLLKNGSRGTESWGE